MSKPIDADALSAWVAEWKAGQDSNNIDYRTGYISALSTVEGMIALMPVLDAIPLEWIQAKYKSELDYGMRNALADVMWLWRKEREG